MKKAVVIGGGFAGMSGAAYLAKNGFKVTLLEKNSTLGGRARQFSTPEGFHFDMGPSWYWMPEVFDRFFNDFDFSRESLYDLKRLDPSYRVFFEEEAMDIPASMEELKSLFEGIEPGAANQLESYLSEAGIKYQMGVHKLVRKPKLVFKDLLDQDLIFNMLRLSTLSSMTAHVQSHFKDERIRRIMEFPVLFLGAKPEKTPALYSLMNYADLALGTWYPMGGMVRIVEAMQTVLEALGVDIKCEQSVKGIQVKNGKAAAVELEGGTIEADVVLAAGDYHHMEQHLLPPEHRMYSPKYWDSRVMAPSSLLFYLGVSKRAKGLLHHNLFFDRDFSPHAAEIYDNPQWPKDPLFYACAPSVTDDSVAPEGMENIFLLIPIAPDLKLSQTRPEDYLEMLLGRIKLKTGVDLSGDVMFKRVYGPDDFKSDYHSFKGNAYGLANTLRQTANLKPRMQHKRIDNLFFAGQLTVPGPGVPPSIISGEIAALEIQKMFNTSKSTVVQ